MNIGKAVKLIRTRLSITQSELADLCKCSQTSLSQIETSKKRPSQRTINKICTSLDIPESIIYIVGMEVADMPENKHGIYNLLYPSLKKLALQLVGPDPIEQIEHK